MYIFSWHIVSVNCTWAITCHTITIVTILVQLWILLLQVPDKQTEVTNKVSKRRRPRPPDLPKKKRHRTIRIALSKTCTSNISIKSFKPTISLQKLFASTSPRLIVKDNELQPAVALTEQYSTLPGQHPVHNWTIGIKRHKFRIYTKWLCALCKLKINICI